MHRSDDRIITTHVGSLARPRPLLETMGEKEHGRPYDPALFERQVSAAVADRVRRQSDVGLDVVTDGEQGKASFFTYVVERLEGFSTMDGEPVLPPSWRREIDAFPDFYDRYFDKYSETVVPLQAVACIGPVSYSGHELIADGICNDASLIGRERVIAGADCGYSSRATFAPEVPESVVWRKFRALVDGARIATARLWS